MKLRVAVCLMTLLVSSTSLWAQALTGYGAVTGTVFQAGADEMPDANVLLSNKASGIQVVLLTTDDGLFNMTSVIPGVGYTLKITRKGYVGWLSDAFDVAAGQTLRFRVSLERDRAERSPSTGTMALVDDLASGRSEGIAAIEVEALPSDGRRQADLAQLAPGVTMVEAQPGLMAAQSLPFPTAVLTDGMLTSNEYFLQTPGLGRQLPLDSVESLQVLTSGFPVDFGRSIGGIVNASTPNGGRAYHGSFYEYYRPTALAAPDAFAAGYNTKQKQNQGGASVGGPLHGKQFFFFVNLEALSRDGEGLNRITNPMIANSTGTAVLASNCTATAVQCAAVTKFLQAQMNVLEPLWEHSDAGFAKIDYRRSNVNTFSFEANVLHYRAPSLAQTEAVAPNGGLIGDPIQREEGRFAKLGWNSSPTPYMVNDFRLGWNQDRIVDYPTPAGLSTGTTGITVAGTTVGAGQPYVTTLPNERRFQLVDSLQQSVNSHLFMAGGDLSETRETLNGLANAAGLYIYPSLTSFADDFNGGTAKNYTSFNQTFVNPSRTFTTKEYNVYASDAWKATDRLTIQLGLRYEKPRLPAAPEVNTSYYSTGIINSPGIDLAPRGALAYKLNDKTVIRAGYGFFFAPFPAQFLDALYLGNGLYQTSISVNPNQANAPEFPTHFGTTGLPAGTTNLAFANSKLRNPASHEATAALERYVGRNSTLTLAYVRSEGYKLWAVTDINLTTPTKTVTYTVDNAAGQSVGTYPTPYWTSRNDGKYAHIYNVTNTGSFWYSAASAQWQTQFSHGLTVSASFTLTQATDNLGPDSALGFVQTGSTNGDNNFDRGRSALAQPERGVVRWTWQPKVDGSGTAMSRLVNGWSLSGIATLASSQWTTPIVLLQGQQFSTATMAYTSSLNGSGGWARSPITGVGSLAIPPHYGLDVRLGRTISFTERIRATVAFEAFNVLNRQSATMVNTVAYLSVAPLPVGIANGPYSGILKPVPGLGEGIASQGYPDGTNARRAQVEFRVNF